ncbi:MAG: DUF1611 domain-containing protein [Gemmatimonadota bacterium]
MSAVAGDSQPSFIILAEGLFDNETSKTAASAIRYLPDRVRCVIDSTQAGRTSEQVLGFGGDIPVVATLEEALEVGERSGASGGPPGAESGESDSDAPTAILIGIAPQGGVLPPEARHLLLSAIDAGLGVWSGLHTFLSDDPELSERAKRAGVPLVDLRRSPADLPVATGKAADSGTFRLLTVGTDCNVGKMTVCLELRRELRARGMAANFAGTGQTGILIDGRGIAVDAVVADFLAGAAERLTLDAAQGADIVLVEGQGSLLHPGYSPVTLGLLHGVMPQAMILCWLPNRPSIYGGNYDWVTIPPLDQVVRMYEEAAGWVNPPFRSRVIGLAANTYDMREDEARRAVEAATELTGLPATDPIRFGSDPLVDAVLAAKTASVPVPSGDQ